MVNNIKALPLWSYWDTVTESVVGAAHRSKNVPSQDNIRQDDRTSPFLMCIAVADGHGSDKSPQSALGAEAAVREAIEHLREFAFVISDKPLHLVKKYAIEELPRRIVKGWIDSIEKREPQHNNLSLLLQRYGTTLLAALVTERYILYLQLGDGDILRVTADGSVGRPIPRNTLLFGNETTSLSMVDKRTRQPNGWLEMEVALESVVRPETAPALIILSTDGYANSFRSDEDFLRVGPDILRIIEKDSWSKVKQELPRWLQEASAKGSGDDISVGILWNKRAGKPQEMEYNS